MDTIQGVLFNSRGVVQSCMLHTKHQENSPVGVYYPDPEQKKRAAHLAAALDLPLTHDTTGYALILSFVKDRLSLFSPGRHGRPQGPVYAEFVLGAAGYRRKRGGREMLLKAIGLRRGTPLSVLDATGGLGRDGFLMASHGCRVHILERNRIVAALLEDGLRRATAEPSTERIAERISLSVRDSREFIRDASYERGKYDVIYLDPMFPPRNKSALVKKEMQLLQQLVGRDDETEQLFLAALGAAGRIVVKRPQNDPPLADRTPSHSISGRTTRFDVYLTPTPKKG